MSEQTRWMLSNILAPVIVAVLVGMASAYATARLAIESLTGRVNAAEANIKRIEEVEIMEIKTAAKSAEQRERGNAERLIRLESKIDLILSRQAR